MNSKPTLLYFVGITNSGKSTLISRVKALLEAEGETVGLVEVGKEMRRRHPPEFFKGKGAMPETEEEAFSIFQDQIKAALDRGCRVVLCDGQPRMRSQVVSCLGYAESAFRQSIVLVDVDADEAIERAKARDSDPAAVDLSLKRIDNDRIQLYEVLCECMIRGHWIVSKPRYVNGEDDSYASYVVCYVNSNR